jgi:hypothetical protein
MPIHIEERLAPHPNEDRSVVDMLRKVLLLRNQWCTQELLRVLFAQRSFDHQGTRGLEPLCDLCNASFGDHRSRHTAFLADERYETHEGMQAYTSDSEGQCESRPSKTVSYELTVGG